MQKEILKFCLEKGFLVDKDLLNLFSEFSDVESVKIIIERVKTYTNQKFITKNLFERNLDKIDKILNDIPQENKDKLKIRLGLTIEISKETNESLDLNAETFIKSQNNNSNVKIIYNTQEYYKKLEVQDFVNYFKNRFNQMKSILQEHSELENLISINKINGRGQKASIIGMVSSKAVTKNKNLVLEVEDLTGKIKILINKDKEDLYKIAEEISLDSVLGFKGSGSREIFFANEIIFPDSGIPERKKSPFEECVCFIGDLHFGSQKFLKESFLDFIKYLNGNSLEASKIKYLFLVGDVVSGVGVYPDQEKELEILDLEDQYVHLAEMLKKIRKDIKIIISPGNHDGVRIMEPQPLFDKKYAWPLYNVENIIITENPCLVNIGSNDSFSGFDVLTYHGFSFPFYANEVPNLILKKAMNCPEEIMKYLLKNRHLAPTHGSTQYYPFEEDKLMIQKVPDIFVSAHTHKCGVCYHNNVLLISISCWESMTPYQEKFGNLPDHCKVPLLNLKTREIKILDFEKKSDKNKILEIEDGKLK